ncbi:MAG: SRPBCC family protein [Caulobacteraceae bacterium]|nr:SRPBCC family protein [Caulobacteraceae bacterium]
MSKDTLSRAARSDAPLTAAVHQRDVAKAVADAEDWRTAALAGRTVTVNRPRAELYAFWRDFPNLARFMENIERVETGADGLSTWTIAAPAGRTVTFRSRITADEPDRLIAWESEPGGDIANTGQVEFLDAPPGRGTWVRVTLAYEPPAGEAGKAVAKLFQKEPKMQARRDLRRFKQLMEAGEIATSAAPDAAPRG